MDTWLELSWCSRLGGLVGRSAKACCPQWKSQCIRPDLQCRLEVWLTSLHACWHLLQIQTPCWWQRRGIFPLGLHVPSCDQWCASRHHVRTPLMRHHHLGCRRGLQSSAVEVRQEHVWQGRGTIMAESVLAFFVGDDVVDGERLVLVGEAVQLAAQWPTCPHRRHRFALALDAADPFWGGLDCR